MDRGKGSAPTSTETIVGSLFPKTVIEQAKQAAAQADDQAKGPPTIRT